METKFHFLHFKTYKGGLKSSRLNNEKTIVLFQNYFYFLT